MARRSSGAGLLARRCHWEFGTTVAKLQESVSRATRFRPDSTESQPNPSAGENRRDARQTILITYFGALYFAAVAEVLLGAGWGWVGQHLGDALGVGGVLGVVSVALGNLSDTRVNFRLFTIGSALAVTVAAIELGSQPWSLLVMIVGLAVVLPTLISAAVLWSRVSTTGLLRALLFTLWLQVVTAYALSYGLEGQWLLLCLALVAGGLLGTALYLPWPATKAPARQSRA